MTGSADRSADLVRLVGRLLAEGSEKTWIEYKVGNADPEQIGEYLSALANSAALEQRRRGYLIWGVQDQTLQILGTEFRPTKVGGEELMNWLTRMISPQVYFEFNQVLYAEHLLVVLEVDRAVGSPVQFKNQGFIRVGSIKKKLKDHVGLEQRLWQVLNAAAVEDGIAMDHLEVGDLLTRLDYPSYFKRTRKPLPETRSHIIESLAQAGLISWDVGSGWAILNLGALLFANRLDDFPALAGKAARVVTYAGTSRMQPQRDKIGVQGYARGFEGLMSFILDHLPEREVIGDAFRTQETDFPSSAIREIVGNALMHQDLSISGAGPMIEIFKDRVEVTNPGVPLIDPERFIDSPPRSRNEKLARAMRLLGMSEERGSGWDKVTFEVELHQLPPPLVEVTDAHTRVVLFGPQPLAAMDRADRARAVYQHSCLKYVNREPMTNQTLRGRFGIAKHNSAQASRLIKEAIELQLIAVHDAAVGPRGLRYVPFWADPRRSQFQ